MEMTQQAYRRSDVRRANVADIFDTTFGSTCGSLLLDDPHLQGLPGRLSDHSQQAQETTRLDLQEKVRCPGRLKQYY